MNKRLLFSLTLLVSSLSACSVTLGSGNVQTESRPVSNFNRVSLNGAGEVFVTQGQQEALTVEAEDNIIPRIKTEVRDGTLILGLKDRNWPNPIRPTKPIKFNVSMKNINGLAIAGAGKINAPNITAKSLDIDASGAADVVINKLAAEALAVNVSGSANFDLSGKVGSQTINIKGQGTYRAPKLESQTAEANISGSGDATLWVRDSLNVNVSGTGDVKYYGSPKVTKHISGTGRVSRLGNS